MAVTTTPLSSPLGNAIVVDTVSNATAENNVRGGATTVYAIEVDNSANAAASYTKFYNSAAPVVGTDAPDEIVFSPANATPKWTNLAGTVFGTALSFATVTAGGTAGTSNPGSSVIVRILCT